MVEREETEPRRILLISGKLFEGSNLHTNMDTNKKPALRKKDGPGSAARSSDDETPRVPRSCQLPWSFLSEFFPITCQTRFGRSTKSAACSASLRSVLRGVPSCARMVSPRAKSVTWVARAATGKSVGISPALIPSRKRRSTSAAPPATALCRNR